MCVYAFVDVQVIIMAFTCTFCGFRNSEVKGGGAVPSLGTEVRDLPSWPWAVLGYVVLCFAVLTFTVLNVLCCTDV